MALLVGDPVRQLPDSVRVALETVKDPEIPTLNVLEMGVIRDIALDGGKIAVTITPTYSGCPAMRVIELDIVRALDQAGFPGAVIRTIYAPAWTTDWLTDGAREKLRRSGIAPPPHSSRRALMGEVAACPHCGSPRTEKLSEFGSTACKAIYRCLECGEPFDHFKCI